MITTIPDTMRRALAIRASLELLGFDPETQVFISPATMRGAPAPPPPGEVSLIVILALNGNPREHDWHGFVGHIGERWVTQAGYDDALLAWNALSQEERRAERSRWIPQVEWLRLNTNLIERGVVAPVVAAKIGAPPGRN